MDNTTNQTLNENNTTAQQAVQSTVVAQPVYAVPHKKPLFSLEKRDNIFSICAVVFCIFTAVFGIFGGYALGYLISCVLMMGLFTFYLGAGAHFKFLPFLCGVLSVANGAVFIFTSNGSVRFFSAMVSFLLGLVCFDGTLNHNLKGNRETLGVFYTATATIGNLGITLKSLFAGDGGKKTFLKALIGLVCAIPALLIIVPLLISSDDAFRGMMDNIFTNAFADIFKALFGIILSVFVISYGFSLRKGRILRIKKGEIRGIEGAYIVSFLSAIGFCYLLYLFSQLAYFFSAFSGFLPNRQITYAQYARKGFFEMCVISVINLIIVFLALLLAKKKEGKASGAVKALATFIAVFTLIIIATAISKMVLYIGEYGMTILRLTTSAFMVFLAIVFISVIFRIFLTKINIIKTALIAAGCILLCLGTLNVNGVCARYNYENYVNGKLETVDINALYNLGDEGIPYLVKLAESEDENIVEEARYYLSEAVCFDYFENLRERTFFSASSIKSKEKHKGFERYSIPRKTAYENLYKFIEKNPEFSSECMEHLEAKDYLW